MPPVPDVELMAGTFGRLVLRRNSKEALGVDIDFELETA